MKWKRIFIMGRPLAGKSTQCNLLAKKLDVFHLSIGNLMRKALKDNNIDYNIREKIRITMEKGILLDAKTKQKLFSNFIKNIRKTILFDGYPRNLSDVEESFPFNLNEDIFILLDLSFESAKKRLESRYYCIKCSNVFIIKQFNNQKCNKCNIILSKRSDDKISIFLKRIEVYNKLQNLVIEELKNKNIKIKILETDNLSINQIHEKLFKIII